VILMEFGDYPDDGHFRVLIGYNDTSREVTMLDPWDRDNDPPVVHFTYDVFCGLWDLPEPMYNVTYFPNFAAIVTPWKVKVSIVNIEAGKKNNNQEAVMATVVAEILYPCPYPFCNATGIPPFIAHNSAAQLTLPSTAKLMAQNKTIIIGDLLPGHSVIVKWDVSLSGDLSPGEVEVEAWGLVSGSLPKVPKFNSSSTWYPAYKYTDVIGGTGSLSKHILFNYY